MNVFMLDRNMEKSAQMLDDAHLKAQINEAYQILMANWNKGRYPDAKIGHIDHPVTVHYRSCGRELVSYLKFLLYEYKYRFGKMHQNYFWYFGFNNDIPCFMPKEFSASKTYVKGVMTDNIEEIRHYIMTKTHTKPLTWTNREKPDWWEV